MERQVHAEQKNCPSIMVLPCSISPHAAVAPPGITSCTSSREVRRRPMPTYGLCRMLIGMPCQTITKVVHQPKPSNMEGNLNFTNEICSSHVLLTAVMIMIFAKGTFQCRYKFVEETFPQREWSWKNLILLEYDIGTKTVFRTEVKVFRNEVEFSGFFFQFS